MFLATLMDQSKRWRVGHEPVRAEETKLTKSICDRFSQRDYYGEVNSRLRYIVMQVPVAKHGVIIRDPHEHGVSMYNRNQFFIKIRHRNAKRPLAHNHYSESLALIDNAVQAGAITIRFEKMVSDREYLAHLLRTFGIDDIPDLEAAVRKAKRNTVKEKVVKDWDGLPPKMQQHLGNQSDWFREKYYAGQGDRAIPNPL
jgi:hypothetical protein